MNARTALLLLTAVTVGITAGVMYCYLIATMPGIGRLPDRGLIRAFQNIDREIVNPAFVVLAFLGGAVCLVATTVLHRDQTSSRCFRLLVAATAIYIVDVVGITFRRARPQERRTGRLPGGLRDGRGGCCGTRRLGRPLEPASRATHPGSREFPRPRRRSTHCVTTSVRAAGWHSAMASAPGKHPRIHLRSP